jgi:hypothetical protein
MHSVDIEIGGREVQYRGDAKKRIGESYIFLMNQNHN